MSGRGEGGRGRGLAAGGGRGSGPAGRGRGLQTPPPVPVPQPTETSTAGSAPAAATRTGRGRAQTAAPPTATPTASAWGRGRGMSPAPAPVPTSSGTSSVRAPPGLTAPPQAAAAAAPAAATPASAASSTVLSAAPVVNLDIDLSDLRLALPDVPLYKRPEKGTRGREIRLQSNLFKVEFANTVWYKYDVEISTAAEEKVELRTAGASNRDKIQSRRFNRLIMAELFRKHKDKLEEHWPAYDGRKTLICAKKFFDTQIFEVNMEANERGRSKQFFVKMKCTMHIDVSHVQMFYNGESSVLSPEVLQAANIVIDSSLGRNFVAVNRSYYAQSQTLRDGAHLLSGGKELRPGIYTSMVFAQWKPLLVVDKSNTAFYKSGPLLNYIAGFFTKDGKEDSRIFSKPGGLSREEVHLLSRDLKGVTVRLKHAQNGRCVKINSLTEEPASQIQFRLSDEKMTTVAQYFNERYGDTYGRLKHPNFPCVKVLRANGTKTDFYPLEVCEIKENQPFKRKLNPAQTANMIRKCQEPPQERMMKAMENVRIINQNARPLLTQHGVRISETPVETVGRQIDSPHIQVKNQTIQVRDGRWRQREFHVGASLRQWCVVDCAGAGRPMREKLANAILKVARNMKLDVAEPLLFVDGHRRPVQDIFREVKRAHDAKRGPMMAVIILGFEPIYPQVKRLSETVAEFAGIITQCIKQENLRDERKFNEAFVDNLLKKMNVKLGGVNNAIADIPKRFRVSETKEPFIVIGADVSHPGVGDFMTPSIAAVVGSLDYIPSKYWTEIRVQTNENNNRIEYIKDLKEVAMKLLQEHFRASRNKPSHIYYIRDGVSDGQFEDVKRREIGALREACKSLGSGDYRPKMTVLIAQKRHHTRFNVMDKRDGCGRTGNVPPGTYIDSDVVHPVNFDLYMYTHQGLLGTSRPTHYHLIHSDDNTFTTDDITEIIYHLCHCYARTTSSVSIPAPIYYAHLAAFRAKEHVKGDSTLTGSDSQSSASGGDGAVVNLPQYQRTCSVYDMYRGCLYYA